MRTFVELDKLAPLVEGREENPFAILGPHEVDDAGRRALSVRAFLPESDKAWVVDPGPCLDAADAANPSGRFVRSHLSLERRFTPRHLHVAHHRSARPANHDARSLRLRAPSDRLRSAPARRRTALEELQPAGRPIADHRRRRGGQFRRLGAQCQRA